MRFKAGFTRRSQKRGFKTALKPYYADGMKNNCDMNFFEIRKKLSFSFKCAFRFFYGIVLVLCYHGTPKRMT